MRQHTSAMARRLETQVTPPNRHGLGILVS